MTDTEASDGARPGGPKMAGRCRWHEDVAGGTKLRRRLSERLVHDVQSDVAVRGVLETLGQGAQHLESE
ncbi:hypothetical protein GCM10020227_26490 [Streptomyces flavovirens]